MNELQVMNGRSERGDAQIRNVIIYVWPISDRPASDVARRVILPTAVRVSPWFGANLGHTLYYLTFDDLRFYFKILFTTYKDMTIS